MFKSSFAKEVLLDAQQSPPNETENQNIQAEILPKQRHSLYKSNFAASTHGPLDNIDIDDDSNGNTKFDILRRTISTGSGINFDNVRHQGSIDRRADSQDPLHTSDLGASDFSSSELWPNSASPSPFHYNQRYKKSSYNHDAGGDSRSTRLPSTTSFLNLQSSMPFSHLKKACKELDLGMENEDWIKLEDNLLKDINKNHKSVDEKGIQDELVNLGDFLSELQSVREEQIQGKVDRSLMDQKFSVSTEDVSEHLSTKALTAKLAAKELETLQVRLECQQLYNDNIRLREEFQQLKETSGSKKFLELQKEVEHLHWQLNKMENSRKLYEIATGQLVTFLEQVSTSLVRGSQQGPDQLTPESLAHVTRLAHAAAGMDMARSKSVPGLVHLAGGSTTLIERVPRRVSAREKRARRSSSVGKTRVSSASPLPSLAEQDDCCKEEVCPEPSTPGSDSCNQSTDSIYQQVYKRSNSVSDPLCVSTPKSYNGRMRVPKRDHSYSQEVEHVSDSETVDNLVDSKRGTLTSLSSSSSATPPSTSTEERGDTTIRTHRTRSEVVGSNYSSDSLPSLALARKGITGRSMSSLLHESSVDKMPPAVSQTHANVPLDLAVTTAEVNKAAMASKASRLLRSIRLMLAREKSYDVSTAEGRKRGRTVTKGPIYSHRCGSGSPCPPTCPLAPGSVLKPPPRGGKSIPKCEQGDTLKSTKNKPSKSGDLLKKTTSTDQFSAKEKTVSAIELVTEDNCEMCQQDKQVISGGVKQKLERRGVLDTEMVGDIKRSKSDVQETVKLAGSTKEKSSSKLLKRSRSFQRILSYSMLNRSKEYRL